MTSQRRSPLAIVACVIVTALSVWADHASKNWAEERLSAPLPGERPEVCEVTESGYPLYQRVRRAPLVVIEDVFDFEYAENCGAAFGLLRSAGTVVRTAVFGIAASVATIVLFFLFVQGRGGPWFAASVPMVVSGALGNLIDRIRYGYVVDFIHVHYKEAFDYPTFNVADITITIGVIMLVIDGFKKEENRESEKAAEPAPAKSLS